MKKIAIISTSYYPNIWNGQGRSTFSTAYGLSKKGYDVDVFTFTSKASTSTQQDGQVTVHYIGGITKDNATSLPFESVENWNAQLLPMLKEKNFDTIILNNWHGYEAAKKFGKAKLLGFVPFLYSFTGWLKPLGAGLELEIKKREIDFIMGVDTLVTHTEKFGNKLATYTSKEVLVVPNCHLDLGNVFDKDDIVADPNKICFVGRVNVEKNIERIIRVLPFLQDVRLVISSPETAQGHFKNLLNLAKALDVEHRIDFLGWQPTKKVKELYRSSALAIVPSQFEPYGYSALDPMALGVPVIVSEWSFLEEYLGEDSMVFSSLEQLREKIIYTLNEPKDTLFANAYLNKQRINSCLSESYITNMLETII